MFIRLIAATGIVFISATPIANQLSATAMASTGPARPAAGVGSAETGVDPIVTAAIPAAPLVSVNRTGKGDRLPIHVATAAPTGPAAFAELLQAGGLPPSPLLKTVSIAQVWAAIPRPPRSRPAPPAGTVMADLGTPLPAADAALSAYANPDMPIGRVTAPFAAVFFATPREKPKIEIPQPDITHLWMLNPIPAAARSPAEVKCMAEAIYFESRSEPFHGQVAVAHVVINRLKNPAYPGTVCGVVYQNKDWRNSCQFSFACDGIRDVVTDRAAWNQAMLIAQSVLATDNGYLSDVGDATHYHAVYVKPRWARTMAQVEKVGRHIFYRTFGGGWI